MINSLRQVVLGIGILIIMMVICQNSVLAAKPSPIAMLDAVSSKMIAGLNAKKQLLKSDRKIIFNLVHKILLPHVDMDTMAKIVLGRNIWNAANNEQREEFKKHFTIMLIRTYASALESYDNEAIKFLPTRVDFNTIDRGLVRSQIIRGNGAPPIDLDYRVIYSAGKWLVYDMSVEGVSMIQSMSSQFAGELSQGGMVTLLARMREHNKGY